jgi:hypothetical protein
VQLQPAAFLSSSSVSITYFLAVPGWQGSFFPLLSPSFDLLSPFVLAPSCDIIPQPWLVVLFARRSIVSVMQPLQPGETDKDS